MVKGLNFIHLRLAKLETVNLTKDEIESILNDARTNILGKHEGIQLVSSRGFKHTTIVRISDKENLILVKGNKWVGYEHINMRHSFWSTYNKWEADGKLSNPTRMPDSAIPKYYTNIADEVFKVENKTESKSSDFDIYVGNCIVEGDDLEFRLVLYAGTKIIQSLFPLDRKLKKPKTKGFNYARGIVRIQQLTENERTIFIPYYDEKLTDRFVIGIVKHELDKVEDWIIAVLDDNGKFTHYYYIFSQDIKNFDFPLKEDKIYQHNNLSFIENHILEIEKHHLQGTKPPYELLTY